MFTQGDVEDDETIPDKESDIKPRFHRSRRHSMGRSGEEVIRSLLSIYEHWPDLSYVNNGGMSTLVMVFCQDF